MKKELRFPSIIGLILLLAAIVGSIYLTSQPRNLNTKASGDCRPSGVQVTNITNNTANISYTTTAECLAVINLRQQVFPDLQSGKLHYFQIIGLQPATEYNFSIASGGSDFIENSYKFMTAATPTSPMPDSRLAWGKVYNSDGRTPANAIVFLNIPGASPLSSVVSSDGNWSISLATSYNDSRTDWFKLPESPMAEDIVVINFDGTTTQIVSNTAANNPVPDIIIGQNSFAAPSVVPEMQTGNLGDQVPALTHKKVDVTNPREGDIINTAKPQFFGVGPANSRVIIEIHSTQVINGESQSDQSGAWHWSPPQDISPGVHTITVKSQNPLTGVWESVTRTFTVLAQDSNSLSYEASSSAGTISPSPTRTPSPFPTTVVSPTFAPTLPVATLIPTTANVPTTVITQIPTEIITTVSPIPSPPVSGGIRPTFFLIFGSLLFLGLSVRFIL